MALGIPDNTNRQVSDRQVLTLSVKDAAHRVGFDLVGIAPAVSAPGFESLIEWLNKGFAGEMSYLPRRASAYEHPEHLMPTVRSIVMLGINYHVKNDPKDDEAVSSSGVAGRVARYAQGSVDYHDLLRCKLKDLADVLHQLKPACRTRGVVDTAPLLERDFARLAGLGWFGKNTMLINKRAGSWLLLAAMLTDLDLDPDLPHNTAHCGTCTRCLDVCPTDAFPAPYVLDARKCISYLTIELRNPIPLELRDGVGNWLFGCDLCQDVCPWNRKAPITIEPAFQPKIELNPANAIEILKISKSEFSVRYAHTPFGRPGWEGMRRNAAIVVGNSGNRTTIPELQNHLNDVSPVVREAVAWALNKLNENCSTPDSELDTDAINSRERI